MPLDITTYTNDDGSHAIVTGASLSTIASEDPTRAPAIQVAAGNHQGIAITVTGGPFSGAQTVSVYLKGNVGGESVHAYFGYSTTGDWGANPTFTLTNQWAKYDFTWTPTAQRATAALSIRSESQGTIIFAADVALPAPKVIQTLAELALAKDDLLVATAPGKWARLPKGPIGTLLAVGRSGYEWVTLNSATPAIKPPPPPPPPASGGTPYSNATLFADTSWWRNPVPANPPLHASSDLWRRNLCAQVGVDPDATGAFGVLGATQPSIGPWFNTQDGNCRVYVVGPTQPLVGVAHRNITGANKTDGTVASFGFGPWLRPEHDQLMEGVPIPPGATPSSHSADHAMVILQVDAAGNPTTTWDLTRAYPVGDPVIQAAVAADGRLYDGDPLGTFEGKPFAWTVSGGGRMQNLSQHNGVWKDIQVNGVKTEWKEHGSAATSIPLLAGLITPEECKAVLSGTRDDFGHCLKGSVSDAWVQALAPAPRCDGTRDSTWIPEGARVFLDITDFSPYAGEVILFQALVKTLARYGIMFSDKTGAGFDAPMWRDSLSYPTQPYGAEFFPSFFGVAGQWKAGDILKRIPWQKAKVLDSSVSPA